ncbi:MAG: DsbA family protein [Acidimicrobiales bacterium]
MALDFGITFDYRCPFARNANEHVVAALPARPDWNVRFVPFSLDQVHVEDGGTPVWDNPTESSGLLAQRTAMVVREKLPEAFPTVHVGLFAARHDSGLDIRDASVIAGVLEAAGLDAGPVLAEASEPWALSLVREEHERSVNELAVFGVPTFMIGKSAVFVRLMTRPQGDAALASATIDHVLSLITATPELNELKHTTLPM